MISTLSLRSLKKRINRSNTCWILAAAFFIVPSRCRAVDSTDYPTYVQQEPNPRDYTLFGTSGWDGNWYVGYNTCWIKKLPPIPLGNYERYYLGAKLGRMKSESGGGKPWERKAIPGEIYIAISSTMAWTKEQSHLLTPTSDISLEGDPESAIEGTGSSTWFWVEIPASQVNLTGDNYIALWSPTPELTSVSSSPVLAASIGGKEVNSWLSHSIKGEPPRDPAHTGATAISFFQPAISLKAIPQTDIHPIQVKVVSWQNGRPDHLKPIVTARVAGDSVVRAWLEYSKDDSQDWKRLGHYYRDAPYIFNVDQDSLPRGHVRLRVCAANIWEEQSTSDAFNIDVSSVTRTLNP